MIDRPNVCSRRLEVESESDGDGVHHEGESESSDTRASQSPNAVSPVWDCTAAGSAMQSAANGGPFLPVGL